MGYLFWKDGRMQCPPCSKCGHQRTSEYQDVDRSRDPNGKVRHIYVECMVCGHRQRMGTYKYLGGHNFARIGD